MEPSLSIPSSMKAHSVNWWYYSHSLTITITISNSTLTMATNSNPTTLNLGPNPRRRESFSSSYNAFETAQAAMPDGRPAAHHVVTVAEDSVFDDDDGPPVSPRAFVHGGRSFSASFAASQAPKIPPPGPTAVPPAAAAAGATAPTAMSHEPAQTQTAQGGWWFNGVKD
jgi:hypothetical protein